MLGGTPNGASLWERSLAAKLNNHFTCNTATPLSAPTKHVHAKTCTQVLRQQRSAQSPQAKTLWVPVTWEIGENCGSFVQLSMHTPLVHAGIRQGELQAWAPTPANGPSTVPGAGARPEGLHVRDFNTYVAFCKRQNDVDKGQTVVARGWGGKGHRGRRDSAPPGGCGGHAPAPPYPKGIRL